MTAPPADSACAANASTRPAIALLKRRNAPPETAAEVERHLLVPRSTRVRRRPASPMRPMSSRSTKLCTSSSVAAASRVRILAHGGSNGVEAAENGGNIAGGEDARAAKGLGPGATAGEVVLDQPSIDRAATTHGPGHRRLARCRIDRTKGVMPPSTNGIASPRLGAPDGRLGATGNGRGPIVPRVRRRAADDAAIAAEEPDADDASDALLHLADEGVHRAPASASDH